MKNGKSIAQVTDADTSAKVDFVQNERGTVLAREVTYSDGLGQTRTASIPDAVARVLVRTDEALRKKAGSKVA